MAFFLLRSLLAAGVAAVSPAADAELRWGRRVAVEGHLSASPGNAASPWRIGARASPAELVDLIFMLRHETQALVKFEQTLLEVSTPGSVRYGHHLSKAEVEAQLPPVQGALDVVLAWLAAYGVERPAVHAGTDMIEVHVPASVAEEMLQTKLHHFVHSKFAVDLVRASEPYTVPSMIAKSIYLAGNLVQLPALSGPMVVENSLDANVDADFPNGCGGGCKGKVTPDVLRQTYGIEDSPNAGNMSMAVAEFQGQFWDNSDLQHFTKTCQLRSPITVAKQVGKNLGLQCKIPFLGAQICLEALLDIQYIKAIAGDIPLTTVNNIRYSLLNWAKELDGMKEVPLIHSVSYGNDERQQSSPAFMDAVNAQFMKLGARGISILFASGDQGVYGRSGVGKHFNPDFPAASPYVTAVGGTDFARKSVVGAEKAWVAGGGGFSNHFPTPAWQQEAVSGYLAEAGAAGKLPRNSSFNAKGRGYPDVAALAGQQNPYCVSAHLLVSASMMGVAGTSASCPVVAGIFARLNALRSEKGMSPMGFLNPFIYKNKNAFNDVTLGMNNAGGPEGFQAMPGWDPATGFGTPSFPKLRAAALGAAEATIQEEAIVV